MALILPALLGAAWWTLVEYALHRFAFHARLPLVGRRHLRHHARTEDPRLAVAPPASMLLGGGLHAGAFLGLWGARVGGAAFAGFLVAYAAYELVHFGVHHARLEARWFKALKRHHLTHHHRAPDACFGVTSPFWDHVFGTAAVPERRQRPGRA